jgi:hypothetical protein
MEVLWNRCPVAARISSSVFPFTPLPVADPGYRFSVSDAVRHWRRICPIIWSATQDRGQFYGKDLLRESSIKDVRKSRKGIAAERLKGLFHHARRSNGSVPRDNNRWSAGLSQFHMRALSTGR